MEAQKIDEAKTSLSTYMMIRVLLNDGFLLPVGAIKSFIARQERSITSIKVEKSDGSSVIELTPGETSIILDIERTLFDGLSISEAFGRGFRSLSVQEHPFDIQVVDISYDQEIITTYHNCWFSSITTPIRADDYIVVESARIICEKQTTKRNPQTICCPQIKL